MNLMEIEIKFFVGNLKVSQTRCSRIERPLFSAPQPTVSIDCIAADVNESSGMQPVWAPSGRSPRAASMSALLINKFGGFAAWLSLCC
jgi:hypothetical protein